MKTRLKRNWPLCIVPFLLSQHLLHCETLDNSSEIRVVGELGNSTKFDNDRNETRSKILSVNNIVTGPSVVTKRNASSSDDAQDNIVFYQKESDVKKNAQRKRPSQLLLKSTANSSSSLPTVGEGLDLAKASILPKRSSPSVVPSCLGNQVTLKCAAEGNPAPDFTWYKGKEPMSKEKVADFDLNIAPSLFIRASHLTFTPKKTEDFGDYECAASNTLGASKQSIYKIKLQNKGKGVCTESANNKDRQKYNSIVIGTVSSVGMLLVILFIAGFVFWRLNQKEATAYQSLKKTNEASKPSAGNEVSAEEGSEATAGKTDLPTNHSSSQEEPCEEPIQDDFNAQEIGRLSTLLAADWERLARLLGFHQHDVNVIREDSDKIESRCAEMLNRFRRRHGSRETLAESVEELKDIETATAIRQKYYQTNPTW